jgi:hypothetical protein
MKTIKTRWKKLETQTSKLLKFKICQNFQTVLTFLNFRNISIFYYRKQPLFTENNHCAAIFSTKPTKIHLNSPLESAQIFSGVLEASKKGRNMNTHFHSLTLFGISIRVEKVILA